MTDHRQFEPAKCGFRETLQATCVLLAVWAIAGEAPAQPLACGGDYVCLPEVLATEPTSFWDELPVFARAVNAAAVSRCPAIPVSVVAGSPEEGDVACSAARTALELLGRCRIHPRKPFDVHIVDEVRHPQNGAIFGLYDPFQQRAVVARPSTLPALVEGTPYAILPPVDFYRSLIVHEVVHAVMHQNLNRRASTHAAYEYPAYALQIESLPPEVRDGFLQSFDQQAVRAASLFNDAVLLFDPFFFAARAYHHFKDATDGCAHISALLDGEVDFIASTQM